MHIDESLYSLRQYLSADGSFCYEKYRAAQEKANARKIDRVWVTEEKIDQIASIIRRIVGEPRFGICHGTRRGLEQKWMMERLDGCKVIGTEIASNAADFDNTIQWDFHEVKPEWIGSVDFIYSNSFDHCYDPKKCLNAWMSCLRPGGVCVIEHHHYRQPGTKSDPFGAHIVVMTYLIALWGGSEYHLREMVNRGDAPTLLILEPTR